MWSSKSMVIREAWQLERVTARTSETCIFTLAMEVFINLSPEVSSKSNTQGQGWQ